MKVFIDFDDVVFNTKQFSAELKIFFSGHGVDEKLFLKHYYAADDSSEKKLFDPEGLFSRLEKYEKIDASKLRADFAKRVVELSGFVFSDATDFLKFVGKENAYLISFGLADFQNKKIIGCKVNELVNGCVVTKGSKAAAIAQVMEKMQISSTEKIIFIDDRVEQVQDIKKAFPEAVTFLLCRSEGRYCDSKNEYCDFEIHSLKEAQEIIKAI